MPLAPRLRQTGRLFPRPSTPGEASNKMGKGGENLSVGPAQRGDQALDRRTLLKPVAGAGTLAATGKLSAPALAQGAAARTLLFVPKADLANFDPIWGTQYVVRNASAM